MRARWLAALPLLVATALASATPAEAQEISDRSARLAANLALGVAGELDTYSNNTHGEADLDPSVGFDLRAELPVLDFLVIGGWFELLTYEPDRVDREETIAFDGFVRLRWVFEVIANTFYIEPYALLPIGLTLAFVDKNADGDDDVWPGWNTGVLLGAQFLHESGAGGYFEMGWRHAEAYQDVTILGSSVDLSLVVNEMAMNFGFVYCL